MDEHLIPSLAERQALAAQDLAKKTALEKPLAIRARAMLRQIADDLELTYAATGVALDATNYEDDFAAMLLPSYRRAEREFGNIQSADIRAPKNGEKPTLLFLLFAYLARNKAVTVEQLIAQYMALKAEALRTFTNQAITESAEQITRTNQKEIDQAIAKAVAKAAAEGRPASRLEIGAAAAAIFIAGSLWRAHTIAATEIQNAAEAAKSIEADVLYAAVAEVQAHGLAELDRIKEWHTQGDEKVRPAHIEADLQSQPFDEPFVVMDELLMFPGDQSLGATAGNIINCRCSALYFIGGHVDRVITANSDTGTIPTGSIDIV